MVALPWKRKSRGETPPGQFRPNLNVQSSMPLHPSVFNAGTCTVRGGPKPDSRSRTFQDRCWHKADAREGAAQVPRYVGRCDCDGQSRTASSKRRDDQETGGTFCPEHHHKHCHLTFYHIRHTQEGSCFILYCLKCPQPLQTTLSNYHSNRNLRCDTRASTPLNDDGLTPTAPYMCQMSPTRKPSGKGSAGCSLYVW